MSRLNNYEVTLYCNNQLFICSNVFLLFNKYYACILTRFNVLYNLVIVVVPYSIALFIS